MGWLCHTKSSWYLHHGSKMEADGLMRDLKADKLVIAQHRYYGIVFFLAALLQPALIASLWGDGFNGLFVAGGFALMWTFQSTMCVNSLAHCWGEK